MTAYLNTSSFQELIDPSHRKIFNDSYYSDVSTEYERIFKQIDMGLPTETMQHAGAFGQWQTNTEGAKLNINQMSMGEEVEYTTQRYDNSYIITHEMMRDDLSGILGGKGQMGNSVVNNAPELLGKGCRALEDVEAAKILTGGFGNTGYDGVATFSASHPLADDSGTYSNLATGALSPSALKDAITLLRTDSVNEADILTVALAKYLIVGPSLQWKASEILASAKQAYEFSNTENVLPNLEIVVYDRLARTGDTYATTNRIVKAGDIENLHFGWKERPFFGTQQVPGTLDWQCFGYASFVPFIANARGIVGSTGV